MSERFVIEAAQQVTEILQAIGETRRHEAKALLQIREVLYKVVEHRGVDETFENVIAIADEIGGVCFPDDPLPGKTQRGELSDDLSLDVLYARSISVGILSPFVFDGEGTSQLGAKRLDKYFENKGMFPSEVWE